MNTTVADPLFVRAEVEYRREAWGLTSHTRTSLWPDLGARFRRWAGGHGRTAAARPAGTAVQRPRHP